MKLYDNEWGFSVDHNNPFHIFRLLQKVAHESVGAAQVIDLSRGDPGYGFAPSERGRQFVSYLLFLDSKLNRPELRFVEREKSEESKILEEIATITRSHYVPAVAERYLKDLSEFIQLSLQMATGQGLDWQVFDVLHAFFKYSTVSGGTYQDPQGELLNRIIVAAWHGKFLRTEINYEDVIFVNGASHAIGTLFKLLGEEGLNFLTPGDKVLLSSPVYSPYNAILEKRGIEGIRIDFEPTTGEIRAESLETVKKTKGIKVILLIDPNNPTGFPMGEEALRNLAEIAREKNALVITDEVYSAFFEKKESLLDFCPERCIRIQARSKIERSTGLRFGDVLITKEANRFISEDLLKKNLPPKQDFKSAFMAAKAPGGIHGEFQHTTFVPGPAQFLGVAHILLGAEERQKYRETVRENQDGFHKVLGLPHQGNLYYTLFDLNEGASERMKAVPAEEKLTALAKKGVVYMPAKMFFSEEDRSSTDRGNFVRACLVNANPERIRKAAQITLDYLKG